MRSIHICHTTVTLLCCIIKRVSSVTPPGLWKRWDSEDDASLSMLPLFSPLESGDLPLLLTVHLMKKDEHLPSSTSDAV